MEIKLSKLKDKAHGKKAIFLDLDNTIYAYEPCHRYALKESHRFYFKEIAKITFAEFLKRYSLARNQVHKRLEGQAASHSRLLYFQAMLEKETSRCSALDFEKVYWNSFLKKMKREAWVLPFFAYCKKEGKKVGIVTNLTAEIQMRKLRILKLDKKIDFLVTSEEAGHEKPHPAIFRLALKKARAKPAEVFVFGDDPKADRMSL